MQKQYYLKYYIYGNGDKYYIYGSRDSIVDTGKKFYFYIVITGIYLSIYVYVYKLYIAYTWDMCVYTYVTW